MEKITFGERLSYLRKNKGLSQNDLATVVNLTDKSISKWENNEVKPSMEDFVKLSSYFNVSLDFLVSGIIREEDKIIVQALEKWKKITDYQKELKLFFKNNNIKETDKISKMFKITEEGIFCYLDDLISNDDYKLFCSVSKNYALIKVEENDSSADEDEILENYKLKFYDLNNNADINFYEEALNNLKKASIKKKRDPYMLKIEEEADFDAISCEVSDALYSLHFDNPNYYEIVTFLIDNGAVLDKANVYVAIPVMEDDEFTTSFIYRVSKDILQIKEEIKELKKK